MHDTVIEQVARSEGKSIRELYLMMAQQHPAHFTNPEEVAVEWRKRIMDGDYIPYVEQWLIRHSY